MKSYVFRVIIEDDAMEAGEKAYHAYGPALKGYHTWGRTYEEALANVCEAVEVYVEDLREAGSRIPVDPEMGRTGMADPGGGRKSMSVCAACRAVLNTRQLIRALHSDGFLLVRTRGSHHITGTQAGDGWSSRTTESATHFRLAR